jgi:hypothetical protein
MTHRQRVRAGRASDFPVLYHITCCTVITGRILRITFSLHVAVFYICADLYILGERGLVAQWSERSAHNRLVAGSIPAEPRTVAVLTEEFTISEMLEVLMGQGGKRKLRPRRKTNDELFALHDSQLVLKHRSADGLKEARRVLGHYRDHLGQYPPTPELAASFLSQFADLKATTLYRYHSIVQGFQSWYGDKLDTKIKVPATLPDYIEEGDLKKLKAAMATKKTHKGLIARNHKGGIPNFGHALQMVGIS